MNLDAAKYALSAYNEKRDFDDELKSDLIDLIADLLHYANMEGLDPGIILFHAENHLREEIEDERGIVSEDQED